VFLLALYSGHMAFENMLVRQKLYSQLLQKHALCTFNNTFPHWYERVTIQGTLL